MNKKQAENNTKDTSSKNTNESTTDSIFMLNDILPDVTSCFEDEPKRIEDSLKKANIVLDTNTLLLPYTSGVSSLSKIAQIYEKIVNLGRLYIPEQVAREFVKNRPTQLANLYSGISDKISKINVPDPFEPAILDSIKDFKELNISLDKLKKEKKKLNGLADKIKSEIKGWGWNDPVSQAYRPIFKKEIIIKLDNTNENKKDSIVEEMRDRYKCLIPPGYKDSAKNDEGIGDYLIWKTILQLGKHNNCPTIFVSGDEKADWFHRVNDKGFLPRYELEAEYRQVSKGHDFYIIPLSKLLELMDAEKSLVDEIKKEEKQSQDEPHKDTDYLLYKMETYLPSDENKKSWDKFKCKNLNEYENKNENKNEIFRIYSKKSEKIKSKMRLDFITCPYCEEIEAIVVDTSNNYQEHTCNHCNIKFGFFTDSN
ncbi:PIN domain-containing protein [Providencia sp. Me31A]|uniref:PIN domain-containing protein n=1 Tax=Providencia sp. Me31A TaxID=3392637 RepID=UPI003D2CBF07